jgi:putative DNA primase/helicase
MRSSTALASTSHRLAKLSHSDPIAAAQSLAALGLPVFPLHSLDAAGRCSCGTNCGRNAGKHPRTPNGLLDATVDACRIRNWWRTWPEANVAVATGGAAGVWVLDVDPDKGGLESLEHLAAAHGKLRQTWCVETGGKGLHIWFARGDTVLRNSVGGIAPGLDVRADGGYAIVPPSRHRSGLTYRWPREWHPTRVKLAPAPSWLVDLACQASAPTMIPPSRSPIEGGVGRNHSHSLPAAIPEGQRNATLASLAGSMRHRGFGEAAIQAALLAENAERCSPPLPETEVARIARSITRYAPVVSSVIPRRPTQAKSFVEFVNGKAVAR